MLANVGFAMLFEGDEFYFSVVVGRDEDLEVEDMTMWMGEVVVLLWCSRPVVKAGDLKGDDECGFGFHSFT